MNVTCLAPINPVPGMYTMHENPIHDRIVGAGMAGLTKARRLTRCRTTRLIGCLVVGGAIGYQVAGRRAAPPEPATVEAGAGWWTC